MVDAFIETIFQLVDILAIWFTTTIATLALASRPRQGFAKVGAKTELRSHISCWGMQKNVRE
jgi:hypothetical protein